MKRILLFIFIIIIVWLLWVSGFPLPYLLNNYRLNCFADQLSNMPLPPQTKRIGEITKQFGNLGTCSKHGDYYVEYKLATGLSYSQLVKYYKKYHVQVPEINSMLFSSFRGLGTHGPIDIDIDVVEGRNNEYIVSAFDPGYWHNDFRCW